MSELITFISSYVSTDDEGQGLAEYALIPGGNAIIADHGPDTPRLPGQRHPRAPSASPSSPTSCDFDVPPCDLHERHSESARSSHPPPFPPRGVPCSGGTVTSIGTVFVEGPCI